ncbi:MAG: redoxin domain-containing protein [Planctomycetota bacterium]
MARSLLARVVCFVATSALVGSASSQAMLGAPAPAIDLEAIENAPADLGMTAEEITWDALAGRTVVLEFWATWCGPCIAAIPHLNELAESYADADDVIFLSVTDEPVDLVSEFRTKREMKSWIGHDLDRDTIDAFDVRGIPATFLIHDGRVMAKTHPAQLTREHIEAARRGEVVKELAEKVASRDTVDRGDQNGSMPLGRRRGFQIIPGLDPYSALEETPAFQVIVREPDESRTSVWHGDSSATMLAHSVDEVVSLLWGVPRYAVELDESLRETRFDVIVRRGDVGSELVRPVVAAAMGVEVEHRDVEIQGWRAVLGEDGVRLEPSEFDETLGHSTRTSPTAAQIISQSNTAGQLLDLASGFLAAPIDDETGLGDRLFRYTVLLSWDRELMPEELFEATGIRLEPIETEIEGLVVRPIEP